MCRNCNKKLPQLYPVVTLQYLGKENVTWQAPSKILYRSKPGQDITVTVNDVEWFLSKQYKGRVLFKKLEPVVEPQPLPQPVVIETVTEPESVVETAVEPVIEPEPELIDFKAQTKKRKKKVDIDAGDYTTDSISTDTIEQIENI